MSEEEIQNMLAVNRSINDMEENFRKKIEKLQQENSQLKERIEKAIDWTIKYRTEWYQEDEVIRDLKQLLEILKGDNK